jgi:UDP-glucose 4-epimerase
VYETDVGAAIDTNVRGTANVLTAAAEAKVQRVVAMSSKAVYGDIGGRHGPPHHHPISEDDLPMQPYGLYGLAKEFGERFGAIVHRRSGLDVIAIRSGTTFGPGKGVHHGSGSASSTLVERPWAGRSARIAAGGDAVDDFVYYADLARGLVQACFVTGELRPVYHLSSGVGLTLHDIADEVRRRIPSADIEIGPGPIFNGLDHNLHCVLSIDAARRDLSFRPTTLPEWVDDYLGRLDATTRVTATNLR